MALDTREKRQSSTSFLIPAYPPGVVPKSTIDNAARQAAAWVYSGILTGVFAAAALAMYYYRKMR